MDTSVCCIWIYIKYSTFLLASINKILVFAIYRRYHSRKCLVCLHRLLTLNWRCVKSHDLGSQLTAYRTILMKPDIKQVQISHLSSSMIMFKERRIHGTHQTDFCTDARISLFADQLRQKWASKPTNIEGAVSPANLNYRCFMCYLCIYGFFSLNKTYNKVTHISYYSEILLEHNFAVSNHLPGKSKISSVNTV